MPVSRRPPPHGSPALPPPAGTPCLCAAAGRPLPRRSTARCAPRRRCRARAAGCRCPAAGSASCPSSPPAGRVPMPCCRWRHRWADTPPATPRGSHRRATPASRRPPPHASPALPPPAGTPPPRASSGQNRAGSSTTHKLRYLWRHSAENTNNQVPISELAACPSAIRLDADSPAGTPHVRSCCPAAWSPRCSCCISANGVHASHSGPPARILSAGRRRSLLLCHYLLAPFRISEWGESSQRG